MFAPIVPRTFTDADGAAVDPGYYNAALGTTGVALLFPPGSRGAQVQVGAACYIGVRPTNVIGTPSNSTYGTILNGQPVLIGRGHHESDSTRYLIVAANTGTTAVAVVFF